MGISISSKNDYSMLFSSLNNGKNGANSLSSLTNVLSDYSSIKTGSYGKLMKAYYGMDSEKSTSSKTDSSKEKLKNDGVISTESVAKKALNTLETAADTLKDTADSLYMNDKNSVFKSGDDAKVTDAVKSFVKNYNSMLTASEDTKDTSVANRITNMKNITASYAKSLDKIGISIDEDNKLKLDEDKLKAAGTDNVKNVFNGTGSYGYQTSAQASLIGYAANTAANATNSYTSNGKYAQSVDLGNLFNTMF